MLRVARLTDPEGRYFDADLGSGRWAGAGAEELGLAGRTDAGSFRAVLSGRDPRTGRPLRANAVRVTAFDLTFAAPKSVSVLTALGGPRTASAVLDAHRASVDGALSYLAAHALTVRVGTGEERRVVPAGGLVAAQFEHATSRALDPHLHSHVVVANLGAPANGRCRAIDGRGLYAHARAAGALYDAHLRDRIGSELGLAWTARTSGAYELAAVDPTAIGIFSARRAEIREHLFDHGTPTAGASSRARRVAWASTRDAKSVPEPDGLGIGWRRRAASFGIDGALGHGRDQPDEPRLRWGHRAADGVPWERLDEHRFAASLFERERSGVARRDVVAAWAAALQDGAPAVHVDACVASLAPWGRGAGVAEARRAVTDVAARGWELSALGPRPSDPDALDAWSAAAAALDRYRSRWGVSDPSEALGARGTPVELSSMPARRLADHLATSRALADARRRLGRNGAIVHDARVVQSPGASVLER